jgi:hypothetical protein
VRQAVTEVNEAPSIQQVTITKYVSNSQDSPEYLLLPTYRQDGASCCCCCSQRRGQPAGRVERPACARQPGGMGGPPPASALSAERLQPGVSKKGRDGRGTTGDELSEDPPTPPATWAYLSAPRPASNWFGLVCNTVVESTVRPGPTAAGSARGARSPTSLRRLLSSSVPSKPHYLVARSLGRCPAPVAAR